MSNNTNTEVWMVRNFILSVHCEGQTNPLDHRPL